MSQNAFLDLTILGAKNFFTPKIFRPKSALKSVPDFFFFFGNHPPSLDGKSLVKSDSNNSNKTGNRENHDRTDGGTQLGLVGRGGGYGLGLAERGGELLCGGGVTNCDQNSKLYRN